MEKDRFASVTLKDIAERTGVSMVTVHRALNGKSGVGERTRRVILETAAELGYTGNFAASVLKKKHDVICVVLPEGVRYGAHYYKYMWKGIRSYTEEMTMYPTSVMEVPFALDGTQESEESFQVRIYEEVYEKYADRISGLLTSPVVNTPAIQAALERFTRRGIRVVLVDNDFPTSGRLCCIAPNDENTGRLSAELLCEMVHQHEGTILVAAGNEQSLSHKMNAMGFTDFIRTHRPELNVVSVNDEGNAFDSDTFYRAMEDENIIAAYSVRARNTIPMCEAALKLEAKRKLLMLGSDLFDQSAEMLRRGVLKGIIYKNPYEKGYQAIKVLTEYLVKEKAPASEKIAVPISVIMRNNLSFFEAFI